MKPKLPKFPTMLRKMWSGTEVQQWLDENVLPLFEQTAEPLTAAENHGCHAGGGATLPAAVEAGLKARVGQAGMRIDAIESTPQPKPQPQYAQVAPGVVFLGCARLGAAGASDEDILNYAQRTMIPLGTQSLLNALKKAGIKAQANGDEGWVVTVDRASTVMATRDDLRAILHEAASVHQGPLPETNSPDLAISEAARNRIQARSAASCDQCSIAEKATFKRKCE